MAIRMTTRLVAAVLLMALPSTLAQNVVFHDGQPAVIADPNSNEGNNQGGPNQWSPAPENASPSPVQNTEVVQVTPSPSQQFGSPAETTPAPETGNGGNGEGQNNGGDQNNGGGNNAGAGGDGITVILHNSMDKPVNLNFQTDPDMMPLIGNPTAGPIEPAQETQVVMPAGWHGMGTINLDGSDAMATKWETAWKPDVDSAPYVDISLVDGYSVPMTCSCNGKAVTGCNIELWDAGTPCPNEKPGPVCVNPNHVQSLDFQGPPDPFFAPCLGAAYTYPADNDANVGCPGVKEITCCIGSDCPAPPQQKSGGGGQQQKRSELRYGLRGDSL